MSLTQVLVRVGERYVAVRCGLRTPVSEFMSALATALAPFGIKINNHVQVVSEQPFSLFSLLPPPSVELMRSDAMSVEECAEMRALAQTAASTRVINWAAFMTDGGFLLINDFRTLADIGFGPDTVLRITLIE